MIKIIITNNIKDEFTKDEILNICQRSIGNIGEIIIDEKRSFGHYIILENGNTKKYILLSSKANEGRNTYLSQFISTAYSDYILDKTTSGKAFEVFLFPNKSINAKYNKFIYRLLKTCNIKIINEIDLLRATNSPFNNYKEIEDYRNSMRSRNLGNNSTYFSEEYDHINIFGKVFGANGKESAFICFALSKITDKPIWLYQVYDNNHEEFSSKDLDALKSLGLIIKEKISEIDNSNIKIDKNEKDLRDTPKFHYNLLKKYSTKKCYLCSCDIGEMIIGAHIHRVADIKSDTEISIDEKISQIIDGDNGLWLCADHDKLFEIGLVYFNNDKLYISNALNRDQIKFVSKITERFEIEQEYFTFRMKNYIKLHFNRTQINA